jgi:hypothetical protein
MSYVYAYIDGSDLETLVEPLTRAFGQLTTQWSALGAIFVNQKNDRSANVRPGDLPDWELGINLPLERFGANQALELLAFSKPLSQSTGREIVVGVADALGVTEDVVILGVNAGDREYRALLTHLAGL